jgi:hypothetical protein
VEGSRVRDGGALEEEAGELTGEEETTGLAAAVSAALFCALAALWTLERAIACDGPAETGIRDESQGASNKKLAVDDYKKALRPALPHRLLLGSTYMGLPGEARAVLGK